MKPADLDTGATRLRTALKDLELAWAEASEEWDDEVSRAFQEERLEPLTPVVKNTLDAVGRLRLLLHAAQRELES